MGTYLSPHVTDWTERFQLGDRPIERGAFAAAVTAVRDAAEAPGAARRRRRHPVRGAHRGGVRGVPRGRRGRAGDRGRPRRPLRRHQRAARRDRRGRSPTSPWSTPSCWATPRRRSRPRSWRWRPTARTAWWWDRSARRPSAPWTAECARRGLRPLRYGDGLSAREGADGVDVITPHATYTGLPLALHGAFQRDNLAVAIAGAEMLLGGPLDPGPLRRGGGRRCACPAGWSWCPGAPAVILDGAHNPAGMQAMARGPAGRDRGPPAGRRGGVGAGRQGRRRHGRGPRPGRRPDPAPRAPATPGRSTPRPWPRSPAPPARPARAVADPRRALAAARAPDRPRGGRGDCRVACICWRICGRGSWPGSRTPLLHSRAPRGVSTPTEAN